MRASLYSFLNQWDLAITDLDRVIELNPDNGDAHALRGDAYMNKGEHASGYEDYERARILGE